MNYTAPIPLGLFPDFDSTQIQNTLEEVYDEAKKKVVNVINTVSSVANSVEFQLGIASIEGAVHITSLVQHADEVLSNQFEYYRRSGMLNLLSIIEDTPILTTIHKTISVALQYLKVGLEFLTSSISSVLIFYSIFSKTQENIEDRKSAKLSGDKNKILVADLNAVSLTSDYLKFPHVVLGFLVLCGAAIPAIVLMATGVIAAVGAFFLAANVFITNNKHTITTNLLDELKLERHKAFLSAYYTTLIDNDENEEKKAELSKRRDEVDNLSLADSTALKEEISLINQSLEDSDERKIIFHNSLKTANQHFINLLNKKIAKDATLVKEQFAVPLEESSGEEIELSTRTDGSWTNKPENLFEKLSLPEFQSDDKKLQQAVKILKIRLEDRILAEKGDLILGSFGLATTVMAFVLALGVFPLIAPIAIAVGVILLAPKIALVIEEEYDRKPKFLAAMEKLTVTSSELEVEVGDLDVLDGLSEDDLSDLSDELSPIISESDDSSKVESFESGK
ncbi:MAG: hypothetical protein H0T62_00495 [Parachlamydiaceae bacterium]|nr:hypothetical protein [Parachlamydiaceae bacterium]